MYAMLTVSSLDAQAPRVQDIGSGSFFQAHLEIFPIPLNQLSANDSV
jgi:hypothetical protein